MWREFAHASAPTMFDRLMLAGAIALAARQETAPIAIAAAQRVRLHLLDGSCPSITRIFSEASTRLPAF
jgi:hypothetical protein